MAIPALAVGAALLMAGSCGSETDPVNPDGARSPGDAGSGAGVPHGVEEGRVTVTENEDGSLVFDLGSVPPTEGYFEVIVRDEAGNAHTGPVEVHGREWRFEPEREGPLPSRYMIEVTTWRRGADGPEEIAAWSEPFSEAP